MAQSSSRRECRQAARPPPTRSTSANTANGQRAHEPGLRQQRRIGVVSRTAVVLILGAMTQRERNVERDRRCAKAAWADTEHRASVEEARRFLGHQLTHKKGLVAFQSPQGLGALLDGPSQAVGEHEGSGHGAKRQRPETQQQFAPPAAASRSEATSSR